MLSTHFRRAFQGLLAAWLMVWLIAGLGWQSPALALERSDILLDIVTHCVDPALANYCSECRVPRNDSGCGAPRACTQSTEVWALNERFTAMRDIKMCGCPAGFVHGLALPRTPVRGVEDPLRPEGLWAFAWDVGAQKIAPEQLALVVNPQRHRSQNQLHVHLLRLAADARQNMIAEAPVAVADLNAIWATAARAAAAKGLDDYGVLVRQRAEGGYWVLVTSFSPESAYTQWRCE